MPAVRRLCEPYPLFRIDDGGFGFLYSQNAIARPEAEPTMLALAAQAEEEWRALRDSEFRPVSLGLYLGNYCELACSYCFASAQRPPEGGGRRASELSLEAALAGARLVARNCAQAGLPLSIVLNGGGEPSQSWELVRAIVHGTRRIADSFGLGWEGHLTTNGCYSKELARLIADSFTSIALSCDGPPEIQDAVRPMRGGAASSVAVRSSAEVFRKSGTAFEARATILPSTMERQTEIVDYLAGELGCRRVRFEPLYLAAGVKADAFRPEDALPFAEAFSAAQRRAAALGAELIYSGVDLERPHGRFCETGRGTLRLRPDGSVSSCFFSVEDGQGGALVPTVGRYDPGLGEIALDAEAAAESKRRAFEIPPGCEACLIVHHCSRSCPEFCGSGAALAPRGSFRCELNKALAGRWIASAASALVGRAAAGAGGRRPRPGSAYPESVLPILGPRLPGVDVEGIEGQWRAMRPYFDGASKTLPVPAWARRPYDYESDEAWTPVAEACSARDPLSPISVYVHVPYCARRCPFCDCLSEPLGRRGAPELDTYLEAALGEVESWSGLRGLSGSPVTTIHFGGGTPLMLGSGRLGKLVEALRRGFALDSRSELALETTSSLLGAKSLAALREIGFTRLHAGIQCLDDGVRAVLGRSQGAAEALARIREALDAGFVLSADLIYGLPGLSLGSFCEGARTLSGEGVHGLSFYRLQSTERNAPFVSRWFPAGREALSDYLALQCAESIMRAEGFSKNHVTHYARGPDLNLYYRHRLRGEDLVSIGPGADGVVGRLSYRHESAPGRVARSRRVGFPLEGALLETEREARSAPLVAGIMCSSIRRERAEAIGSADLLDSWLARGLVAPSRARGESEGEHELTANGSWSVASIIEELYAGA
jgi:coproporphyrinogen III oxidase-like Fe-S oxidoreductase/sulfatase maturation enzyme AslB (radical SAM superfamily)